MKKYSQYDLIGEELMRLESNANSFKKLLGNLFDKLLDGYQFNLKIPNYLYLRAKVLCEDVLDLSDYELSVEELVYLLYRNFLQSVKEYDDPYSIYKLLFVRMPGRVKIQERGTIYQMEDTNSSVQHLNIMLKKKHVIRGEVLLRDLENIIPNHGLTVEIILETLFIDFFKEYQKGNAPKMIDKLIENLEGLSE